MTEADASKASDDTLRILCDDEAELVRLRKDQHAATTKDDPILRTVLLEAQRTDPECISYASYIGKPYARFERDPDVILIRVSKLDGARQVVVPKKLQERVLYLANSPVLQGHPRTTKMYDTLRRQAYWRLMYSDVENYVANCTSCAKMQGTLTKHQSYLKLCPATFPLQDVAMDLVGPLPKTKDGKRYVLVITDRYTKLARAVAMSKTTAPHVSSTFLSHWVFPYGVPTSVLTDNGPQFIAEFFEFLCATIGVKRVAITAYHAQSNGQTERYNQTLERRLRHFINEHQDDWDRFVQPLTYAYNTQTHRSTGTSPFSLVLSRHPPSSIIETLREDAPALATLKGTREVRNAIIARMSAMFNSTDRRLYMAQKTYKDNYDKHVTRPKVFKVGDFVFVNVPPTEAKTVKQEESNEAKSKLLPRTNGPFEVVQAFENYIVILEDDHRVPTSIDRCTSAPKPRNVPTDPNTVADQDDEHRFVPTATDASDNDTTNSAHSDATLHDASDHERYVIRIIDHVNHANRRIIYNVQLSDRSMQQDVDVQNLPYRLVIRYWHNNANPNRNPNLRKRGRPRKKREGAPLH